MSTPKVPLARVLIVDDHAVVRRGVVFALMALDNIQVVGEAASAEEAIRILDVLMPDVVMLDLRMPGMEGIAFLERVHAHYSHLRMLVLSAYAEPELVRAALAAGATGYLTKDVSLDEMGHAILMTKAGHAILSDSARQALLRNPAEPTGPMTALTKREREVLALVAAGLTNKEIAQELNVSIATARWHVGLILSKLGAANRAEAAAIGQQYDLYGQESKDTYRLRAY